MGCQNSKIINTDILAIPPKLRPLFRRKIEEIRRRRSRAAGESTLSKKELLNESQESEALTRRSIPSSLGDDHDHNRESMSSSSKAVNEPVDNDDIGHAKEDVEEKIEVKDEDDEEKEEEQDKKPNDYNVDGDEKEKEVVEPENDEKEKEKEKEVVEPENEKEKEKEKDEEKEEEKKDEEVEEDGDAERNICAGSPSFRVYYLESLEEKRGILNNEPHEIIGNNEEANTKKEINDNVDQETRKKSSRESSVDSIISLEAESNANNEDQETTRTTKRPGTKNRKRISRAIRKGPVAMKQFLNVKSCYHPSNESTSLLPKKN